VINEVQDAGRFGIRPRIRTRKLHMFMILLKVAKSCEEFMSKTKKIELKKKRASKRLRDNRWLWYFNA
jgi:hypothetical protein